jgi:hypothetical protein
MSIYAENLPWLTFDENFKRPAADLAIRRQLMRTCAGVNGQWEGLTTIGTLDVLLDFHSAR